MQEMTLQRVKAAEQAVLPLISYGPTDPMLIEIFVANKDVLQNLLQIPVGESQYRSLGCWG